jgi:mannose-6-phosphate isomerase-like protein (cupin superfamily)
MVTKINESNEFYTEERCHILELLNDPKINDQLSIARARVSPGVTSALHSLDGLELYYILEGKGIVEIDGVKSPIGPGQIAYIKKDQTQRITNVGEQDLVFLCICQPRFKPQSYKSLE